LEQQILDFLAGLELGPLTLALLFCAAGIEYVFPPFPGDTITLLGAALVGAGGWPAAPVFAAITAGGLLGMAIDHRFGRFVAARDQHWRLRFSWWRKIGVQLDRTLPVFARRPTAYLICNRFLPSIRALFFVAAGMVGLSLWRVLLFGGVSAVVWNAIIFALGAALGTNWQTLLGWVEAYNAFAWLALLAVLALLFWRLRRRRT
jgi:membrane protein DedA with SNARE-associated domain